MDAGDKGIMVAEPNGEVIPEEEVMEGEAERGGHGGAVPVNPFWSQRSCRHFGPRTRNTPGHDRDQEGWHKAETMSSSRSEFWSEVKRSLQEDLERENWPKGETDVDILEGGLLKLDMGITQEGIVGGVENMVKDILESIRNEGMLNAVNEVRVIIGENMKAILGEIMKGGPQNMLKGVLRVCAEVDQRAWDHIRENEKVDPTVEKVRAEGIAEDIIFMEEGMQLGGARGTLEKGKKKVKLRRVMIILAIQFLL